MIAIVDYDTGNLRSVENCLRRLGADYVVSSDAEVIAGAGRVILPGVGEAATAMRNLHARGLPGVIGSLRQPVLGICIGLQLMCRHSEEGDTECMGIFDTRVRRFEGAGPDLKIPHMGWNTIEHLSTPLLKGIREGEFVYFVHSYAPDPCEQTVATTVYGRPFSAAIARENFYGTQFHPEKSGGVGERIMRNFLTL
ncbi:imidazole glycerol phosphate synthase subunit HisH [Bacteroidia bacterium]|nr:imidazole glycerol phosphate synthase subunit HisH [Bacteroidia bacterium]